MTDFLADKRREITDRLNEPARTRTSFPRCSSSLCARALAVLDKEDPDPGALRLACLWARWMVRRQLTEDREGVDTERVDGLIAEASRALDRLVTIRRCHTSASNKIQEASNQVEGLGSELDGILARIRAEIQS